LRLQNGFSSGVFAAMRSLAPYLVTFPLLLAPMSAVWVKPALAQVVPAEQALELLARGVAADAKCNHLNGGERQELVDYLATAEVAETARSSPAGAQSIIARGKAQGRESLCGAQSRDEVQATLAAARDAMARSDGRRRVKPQRQTADANASRRTRQAGIAVGTKTGLAGYGEWAMAYYVERRCGHLSNRKMYRLWNAVLARHNAALKAHGRRAVATTLKRAEARALRQACGTRTAALVGAAYANR
jgi:hypothetical protein